MSAVARFVMLDRDGVINADSEDYIRSVEQWQALPGSLEAIARLNRNGWRVAVCTNQSGIARGLMSAAAVRAIHARMEAELAALGGRIDTIQVCPHGPEDGCACRKPQPGLLLQAAAALGEEAAGAPFIGDTERDLEAARAVGARPLLVRTGKGQALALRGGHGAEAVYADLAGAVDALLAGAATDQGGTLQ